MIVKTKSGFTWDVNEEKIKDWRFCKSLAKCDSNDESTIIQGITFVVPFLMGEDGEEALAEHVKDKQGIIPTEKIVSEFKEIITQLGAEAKKSKSSQD